MKLVLIISILFSSLAYSYTVNRATYGEELFWGVNSQTVYFNTSNSSGMSSSDLTTIFSAASSEFTAHGFSINSIATSGGPVNNRNDVYFMSDTSVFGGGSSVLGLTKVSFEQSTGRIVESDILINDDVFFSTIGSTNNIGDVLTHEIGHFLGLGHSEVHGATMFYSLTSGQSNLSNDDKAGVKHIYSSSSSSITGKVIGGDSIGVFGAHIQAIASSTGEVGAATVSESDGSFIISGLSKYETYYLYIEPIESLSNLPSHFHSAKTNFCASESNYRGKFFQSCRRSEEGRPMGISTGSASSVSVGYISIGCDLSVPVTYMQNKSGSTNSIDIVDANGIAGDAIVGFFSENEATANTYDEFEIDLTDYTVPAGDIYLDIKLVYQKLYSPMKLTLSSMTETIEFDSSPDGYGLYYDSEGNPDLDVIGRIKLDSNPSNNLLKFKITPEKLTDFIVSKPFIVDSFLPDSSEFADEMNFYLMILTVSKKELGSFTVVSEKSHRFQDNRNCVDAPRTYSVSENSQIKSEALQELEKRRNQSDPSIISCGTIGTGGGQGGGPTAFILAFLAGLVISISHRFVRNLQN